MKKFNNFLIENSLMNFLKNGFDKTITLLSKNKQSIVLNLIFSIVNSKTLINSINLIKITIEKSFLINKIDNIDHLKITANNDIIIFNIILKTLSKKFNNEKLLPINFLADINNKQLKKTLMYKTEKQFLIQLKYNINIILTQILIDADVNKNIINKILNKKINENSELQYIDNVDKLDDLNVSDNEKNDNEKKSNNIDFKKISIAYSNYQKNIFNILLKKLKMFNLDIEKKLKDLKNF